MVSIVPPERPKARSRERPMSHCAIITTITTTTTKQDGRKLCFLSFSSKSHKKRSSAHISSGKITRTPLLPRFSLHVCVSGLSAGYLVLPLAFFLHLSVQTVSACDTISIQSLTLSLSSLHHPNSTAGEDYHPGRAGGGRAEQRRRTVPGECGH